MALVDFRLEMPGDKALYNEVVRNWGLTPGYGIIARCPGCREYVLYTNNTKEKVLDPSALAFPVLPDDWYSNAEILSSY
jgi:hypothetical protein